MTDFKISDEAVQAAGAAFHGVKELIWDEESMRAALEAAMPVMFERAGRYTRSHRIVCEKPYGDILAILDPGIPVYRLKEPK